MKPDIRQRALEIQRQSLSDPELRPFIDVSCELPDAHEGRGEIRLVVLGQDPTVGYTGSRSDVKRVLNLDKPGEPLHRYISSICTGLGITLENIYATNLLKSLFTVPPARVKPVTLVGRSVPMWLPLLIDEIAGWPGVPVITLGQPILSALVCKGARPRVRDYWGYKPDWKSGCNGPFCYQKPAENRLGRTVFPFPHQPSMANQFYRERFESYLAFVKSVM